MLALRRSCLVVSSVLIVLPCGRALGASPRPALLPVRSLNRYDRSVVDRVRARAAARLDDPRCGRVLAEFTDRSGRTLQDNLQDLGKSASEYLRGLEFRDGSALATCRNGAVTMAATPGLPRVFVCPSREGGATSRLARVEFQGGSFAEAAVIHEMLHTLGLGENPPSTFEITERVRDLCR